MHYFNVFNAKAACSRPVYGINDWTGAALTHIRVYCMFGQHDTVVIMGLLYRPTCNPGLPGTAENLKLHLENGEGTHHCLLCRTKHCIKHVT